MLDFVFILTIIFEIILTSIIVSKLTKFEKEVKMLQDEIVLMWSEILEINKKIKDTIHKLNKVVSILTNKKVLTGMRLILIAIDVVQLVSLIRSFRHLKERSGFNSLSALKNLLFTHFTRNIILKFLCGI